MQERCAEATEEIEEKEIEGADRILYVVPEDEQVKHVCGIINQFDKTF